MSKTKENEDVFFYGHSEGKAYCEFSNFYPSVFIADDEIHMRRAIHYGRESPRIR